VFLRCQSQRHVNFDECNPRGTRPACYAREFQGARWHKTQGINHALTLVSIALRQCSTGSVEKRKLGASDAKRLQWPLIPGGHTGDGPIRVLPAGLQFSLSSQSWEFDSPIPDGVSSATLVHHSMSHHVRGGDDTCQTLGAFALSNAKLAGGVVCTWPPARRDRGIDWLHGPQRRLCAQ